MKGLYYLKICIINLFLLLLVWMVPYKTAQAQSSFAELYYLFENFNPNGGCSGNIIADLWLVIFSSPPLFIASDSNGSVIGSFYNGRTEVRTSKVDILAANCPKNTVAVEQTPLLAIVAPFSVGLTNCYAANNNTPVKSYVSSYPNSIMAGMPPICAVKQAL